MWKWFLQWPFAPALVVFVGAAVVAGGSLWAAIRQSNFNATIRALEQENIRTLKGSDRFHLWLDCRKMLWVNFR